VVKFLPKLEIIHGCEVLAEGGIHPRLLMGYARHRPAFFGLISRASPILRMRHLLPVGWVQREGKARKNSAAKRAQPISDREVLAEGGIHPRLFDGLRAA
jgi:hypothetical protein